MGAGPTRALTGGRRTKPTSTGCRRLRHPEPGRRSTYQAGEPVQTNRARSLSCARPRTSLTTRWPSLVGGLLFSCAALPDAGAGRILGGSTIDPLTPTLGPPREGRPFFVSGGFLVFVAFLAPQQHLARVVEQRQPLLGDAQQPTGGSAVPPGRLHGLRARSPPGTGHLGLGDLGLEPGKGTLPRLGRQGDLRARHGDPRRFGGEQADSYPVAGR